MKLVIVFLVLSVLINIILLCVHYNTRKWIQSIEDSLLTNNKCTDFLMGENSYVAVTIHDLVKELKTQDIISEDFDIKWLESLIEESNKERENDNRNS